MVLHLPDSEGGFGVTLNDITKNTAFYISTSPFVSCLGVFSQERQDLWLSKDDKEGCVLSQTQDSVSQQ